MAEVLERTPYESDYYAWTKVQAAELRRLAAARVNSTLDLENLAEEVESLGRSQLATVRSQLRRIIEHLLKLEYSPAREPRYSWRKSVLEARDVFADAIKPTLRREVEAELENKIYPRGRTRADLDLREHGEREAAGALPEACHYDLDHWWTRTGGPPSATAWSTTTWSPEPPQVEGR